MEASLCRALRADCLLKKKVSSVRLVKNMVRQTLANSAVVGAEWQHEATVAVPHRNHPHASPLPVSTPISARSTDQDRSVSLSVGPAGSESHTPGSRPERISYSNRPAGFAESQDVWRVSPVVRSAELM